MSELTIQAGWLKQSEAITTKAAEHENAEEKKSYFGGELNLADPIAQKRKEAQEKAWNVVKSAWDNDRAIDDSVNEKREHYAQMEEVHNESVKKLHDTQNDEKALQKLYEVEDGSKEQENLELLKKRQDLQNGVAHGTLTKEEMERLAKIDEQGLTEYQVRGLELNERAGKFKLDIEDANRQMRDDTANITSMMQERLKFHPMVDAQKQAQQIQEAANEEIIGMLTQEAVDHIDETMEEAEEKATCNTGSDDRGNEGSSRGSKGCATEGQCARSGSDRGTGICQR